ncbi:hypothetical protein Tco_0436549 [Tanacetum coccineum]
MYYPRFTKVIIHHFLTKNKTISKRNKISMHTSRDDYLINTLRFVSTNEEYQIYGARLPKFMTSHEMRETKAYKTYHGYVTGVIPPKKARKPAKKSSDAPRAGVAIRETIVKSFSKKKEKITVEKRKGIDLLSKVALTKEAQYEEHRKKSLRDFHKTYLSGSGTFAKTALSAAKIKPSDKGDINNEHDSRSEGSDQERDSGDDKAQSDSEKGSDSEHETDEIESGSESDQEENEEEDESDKEEKNDEFVRTPFNDTYDEDKTKIKDKAEGDEDEGMDYTNNQFDDDVNVSMNEPVDTDEGFIQKEGTDAEMTNVEQGNENSKISQVIEDAHVTLSTIPHKTKVLVTSSSYSSDLASKFLNFSYIPHKDA